jgi:hypothetical protein
MGLQSEYSDYWNDRFKTANTPELKMKGMAFAWEILRLIPPNSKVLDADAVRGDLELLAREFLPVYGLDISEVSIELVKGKGFECFRAIFPATDATSIDGLTFVS